MLFLTQGAGSDSITGSSGSARFMNAFLNLSRLVRETIATFISSTLTYSDDHMTDHMIVLTSPATVAVVVAIAGTILPAISLVLNRSAVSILYIRALRF